MADFEVPEGAGFRSREFMEPLALVDVISG